MNPWKFPLALIAFMGFVAVLPPWMYFLDQYSGRLQTEEQFLIGLVLPFLVLLFIASWVQPGGAR